MPIMDGRKATATIREIEPKVDEIAPTVKRVDGRIPILAVSATLLEADRAQLALHFDGWILKPIDFKRMLRLLSGISIVQHRVDDAYVRGEWERGGWFNSTKQARRLASASKEDTKKPSPH
jgi:CheY-like chemotaxis protein